MSGNCAGSLPTLPGMGGRIPKQLCPGHACSMDANQHFAVAWLGRRNHNREQSRIVGGVIKTHGFHCFYDCVMTNLSQFGFALAFSFFLTIPLCLMIKVVTVAYGGVDQTPID
jgi:hypothetical protein